MAAQPPPYGASAPHQQGYAPPPQQGYAPPPQQGYAPPPQQPVALQINLLRAAQLKVRSTMFVWFFRWWCKSSTVLQLRQLAGKVNHIFHAKQLYFKFVPIIERVLNKYYLWYLGNNSTNILWPWHVPTARQISLHVSQVLSSMQKN